MRQALCSFVVIVGLAFLVGCDSTVDQFELVGVRVLGGQVHFALETDLSNDEVINVRLHREYDVVGQGRPRQTTVDMFTKTVAELEKGVRYSLWSSEPVYERFVQGITSASFNSDWGAVTTSRVHGIRVFFDGEGKSLSGKAVKIRDNSHLGLDDVIWLEDREAFVWGAASHRVYR